MVVNEWATPSAMAALFIGLVLVAYASYQSIFGRSQNFLRPDFSCIIFMWFGYHLSPILALLRGSDWRSFMLSPSHIEHGLWMSLASTVAFIAGYRLLSSREERQTQAVLSWAERTEAIMHQANQLKKSHLFAIAALIIAIFIFTVGGFEEVFYASYTRGMQQWLEHTFEVRVLRFLAVILPLLSLGILALTATFSVSSERSIQKFALIPFCLIAASLFSMHSFSRSGGMAFVGFGIIRVILLGKKDWKIFCFSILTGLWISYVGYAYRNDYHPGLGNFGEAAFRSFVEVPDFSGQKSAAGEEDELFSPESNFLSATESYTAVVSIIEREGIEPFSDIVEFIINLHPFPSGIYYAQRGIDLTTIFRTRGSVGLTNPTLGDLFTTFGLLTPVFYFYLGLLYFTLHRHAKRFGPAIETMLMLILLIGWPLSCHSAFRSLWRIINSVIFAILILKVMQRRGYFTKLEFVDADPLPIEGRGNSPRIAAHS